MKHFCYDKYKLINKNIFILSTSCHPQTKHASADASGAHTSQHKCTVSNIMYTNTVTVTNTSIVTMVTQQDLKLHKALNQHTAMFAHYVTMDTDSFSVCFLMRRILQCICNVSVKDGWRFTSWLFDKTTRAGSSLVFTLVCQTSGSEHCHKSLLLPLHLL